MSSSGAQQERFRREGHGMEYWVWELVAAEPVRRTAASKALNSMRDFTTKQLHQPRFDPKAWWTDFGSEVRRVLSQPTFDVPEFIRRLASFLRETQRRRMKSWEDENARTDRLIERVSGQLATPGLSEQRRAVLDERFSRILRAGGSNANVFRRQLLEQQVAGMHVFKELGEHLLSVPDVVRDMLNERNEAHLALDVLERLGPRGAVFVTELLDQLKTGRHGFSARVLAALIRDDPDHAAVVTKLLASDDPRVAGGAASTLYYLRERARELAPQCVDRLMRLADSQSPVRLSAISALGTVTRGQTVAIEELLRLSRDPQMWARGVAITALGDIGCAPEIVVPRLIACFSEYQEQDPDWTHRSKHERVVYALARFGPDAAPAVPALIERIQTEDGIDQGVLDTLAAIGPAALEALPLLEELALRSGVDVRADDAPLARTIRRIRGEEDGPDPASEST